MSLNRRSSLVVLMSLPRPDLSGGPPTHLPLLKAGLEKAGVIVVPFNYTRRQEEETKTQKVLSRSLDLCRVFYLILRFRPALIQHNSAFDYGTFIRDGMLCLVAKLLRVPLFIKIHGSHRRAFGHVSPFQNAMRFIVVKLSTALGVLSETEKEEFVDRWPGLSGKVCVVKNVIRAEFLRARLRDNNRAMVYFTSRFVKEKGMFDLLKAAPAIIAACPQCHFTFIGDGPEVTNFQQSVDEMGLGGKVTYIQNKPHRELIDLYRSGGIFVFPSHFAEGMPMALLEAMAVGLPAISSSVRFVRGVPSFTAHSMLILKEGDDFAAQIATSVIEVMRNRERRQRIGAMNKIFARQFSQDIVTKEFLKLYCLLTHQGEETTSLLNLLASSLKQKIQSGQLPSATPKYR